MNIGIAVPARTLKTFMAGTRRAGVTPSAAARALIELATLHMLAGHTFEETLATASKALAIAGRPAVDDTIPVP